MSVYVAQFIDDLNNDGVQEILAVHGGDELSDPALEEKMFGRVIVFDGKTGEVLKWMPTPDRRESYYPPQILEGSNGEKSILFGTGGNTRSGSLFVISLQDMLDKRVDKVRKQCVGIWGFFCHSIFYVKSVLADFRRSKTAILTILEALNFD